MPAVDAFEQQLTQPDREIIAGLTKPSKIQDFLDDIVYSSDPIYRCPLRVLRERVGHCFDGAIFAAAMLRRLGHPPLILDMLPNGRDDDHLLTLFKVDGHWGAVAKSNFTGLRFREPVYRSLRELVMSYFEQFYNVEGEKTLVGYTRPMSLKAFDRFNWMTQDEPLDLIAERLDHLHKVMVITPEMAARLSPMDQQSYDAGLIKVNRAGLWRPESDGKPGKQL